MTAHPVEIILVRALASHLATPIFVVDIAGDLLFYNDAAEHLLGTRFDETGAMPFAEWSTIFSPTNDRGAPVKPDELPLSVAVHEQRPAHGRLWIRALDGARRRIDVSAMPLRGQWGKHLGAVALFWEVP